MSDINLIKPNTDLSNIVKLEWDAWYGVTPLDVYEIPGHNHSIGGHWGENNYWCCKRGVNPNYETLMQFNGSPCQWSYSLIENNFYKYKYDQKSIEKNYKVKIIRNNEVFYEFIAYDMDWAITKARMLLFTIKEHAIDFNVVNYEKQIIGREIMWHKAPCIIESYSQNNNLMIVPNYKYITNKDFFKLTMGYYDDEENNFVMEDLFAESILWFNFMNEDQKVK